MALTSRAVDALRKIPQLPGCPYVFWNQKTATRYERINETFARARKQAGLDHIQLKDFRRELGIVIAESGQPLHVAKTQLGHSSVRTTEQYYAMYSPEFAVNRAREVLETRGRQVGDTGPEIDPSEKPPKAGPSNILEFKDFKRGSGGGGRIRTDA